MIFRVVGRLTVRFFKWIGRTLVGLGRNGSQHLGMSLFVLVLVAGLGFAAFETNFFGLANASSNSDFQIDVPQADVTTGQVAPAPSESSKSFLAGLYYQDGQRIWNALSDRYKSSLTSQNINEATIQDLINTQVAGLKKQGLTLQYVKIAMDGTTALSDGATLEVYTNYYRVGNNLGNADVNLVVDKNQKVDLVQTPSSHPEPLVEAIFLHGSANSTTPQGNATATNTQKAQEGQFSNQATQSATDFMAATTNFDAAKLWSSFSADYQKQLQAQNVSQATIQKTFDDWRKQYQQKQQALSYQGYALQDAVNFAGNRTLSEYTSVLTLDGEVHTFSYKIFTDATGKITSLGITDPILSQALNIKAPTTSSSTGN